MIEFDEVFRTDIARLKDLEFRQYRGLYLNADITDDKNVDQWFKKNHGLTATERLLNHLHVYDVAALNDYPEQVYAQIADEIEEAWNKRLGDNFIVEQFEDYGPTLTFYRRRDG